MPLIPFYWRSFQRSVGRRGRRSFATVCNHLRPFATVYNRLRPDPMIAPDSPNCLGRRHLWPMKIGRTPGNTCF